MAHEVDNNLSSTGFIFNKRIDLSQELNNKITLKLKRRLTAIKIDIKYKNSSKPGGQHVNKSKFN